MTQNWQSRSLTHNISNQFPKTTELTGLKMKLVLSVNIYCKILYLFKFFFFLILKIQIKKNTTVNRKLTFVSTS